jgi:ubiquitin carboxyl-terminal hydrolase 5/13
MTTDVKDPQKAILENLKVCPELLTVRVPTFSDRVFKEECAFSFDTPFSSSGLYVSLTPTRNQYRAYGAPFVNPSSDEQRIAPHGIFLHIRKRKIPKLSAFASTESTEKPTEVTKVAIGVDGGFQGEEENWEITTEYNICHSLFPGMVSFPSEDLPDILTKSVSAIISRSDDALTEASAWEEPPPKPSKYADGLIQEENGKKILPDPSEWRCEESGMRENLWLNLSDGYIGSGRRNWDGSGGTGAALSHFEEMEKQGKMYPLCVKLGTISSNGADVFSYARDESDMVTDPHLAKHLAHWGINIMQMEKTDKTMAELQIELNLTHNWGQILEDGATLVNCYGPGRMGLQNLGNTCYMNSILQSLMSLSEFEALKHGLTDAVTRSGDNPTDDLMVQFCKIARGVHTDRYFVEADIIRAETNTLLEEQSLGDLKHPSEEEICISPMAMKVLVGKGHSEFSSNRQQDAAHFLQHLFSLFETYAIGNGRSTDDMSRMFTFELEDRVEMQSGEHAGKVVYHTQPANILSLGIPLSAVDNQSEIDDEQKRKRQKNEDGKKGETQTDLLPNVPWKALLQHFSLPSTVDMRNSKASKTTRIKRFPRYLWIQLQRYILDDSWQPQKLEHTVFIPEEIDLSHLKGDGMQVGEEEMPEEMGSQVASNLEVTIPDASIVTQIVGMGFSDNAAKRAALATLNAGADAAMNWILMHMEDSDLNDPLPSPSSTSASTTAAETTSDPTIIGQICSMGFSEKQAAFALQKNENNGDAAVMWLFENSSDVESMIAHEEAAKAPSPAGDVSQKSSVKYSGKYKLRAFISHVGKNTGSGHYVCHIKSNEDGGKWRICNDRKVSWSSKTPVQYGYMYLFETMDCAV